MITRCALVDSESCYSNLGRVLVGKLSESSDADIQNTRSFKFEYCQEDADAFLRRGLE